MPHSADEGETRPGKPFLSAWTLQRTTTQRTLELNCVRINKSSLLSCQHLHVNAVSQAAPFRGAEQADIAIEVIQQLAGGFVEGRDDADAAEAGNGVPDGLMGRHAVRPKRLRRWRLVQRQDVVLNGVQRLDIQTHSILPTHQNSIRQLPQIDLTVSSAWTSNPTVSCQSTKIPPRSCLSST